jgi:recombinational DNA repair protein RecR
MNSLDKFLIYVIIALLIYLALKPSNDSKYINSLHNQFEVLQNQIDSLSNLQMLKLDSIKIIERKQTIIKNYYNEIIKSVDTLSTDAATIRTIRQLLDSLGSARFD